MPELPELLTRAGLDWRWAEGTDLRFVVASWLTSTQRKFLDGGPCPWAHLAETVAKARAAKDQSAMLRRLFESEMKRDILGALSEWPALVVYDVDTPTFILAWGHRDYRYTKQGFRRMGLAKAIRTALESHQDEIGRSWTDGG
jgi:hypothetical protein